MYLERPFRVAVFVDGVPSEGGLHATAAFVARLCADEVLLVRVIRPVGASRMGDSAPLIDLAEREAWRSLEPLARLLPEVAVERVVLVGENKAGELRRWLTRQLVDLLILLQPTRPARFGIPRRGTLGRQTPAFGTSIGRAAPFVILYVGDEEAIGAEHGAGGPTRDLRAS
ncbi:MAG TPA: hypothetical protein VFA70_09495 [Dehalococcoidia bacterium]|jgi:hypothetical protein|nr:hypothetical protein [Dehalococcoidia bacterium]